MSRIGKLPVPVPASVEVTIDGQKVSVKGPKGSLEHTLPEEVTISREEEGALKIERVDDGRDALAAHGLSRTLINNLVVGVTDGFERKLEIVGTGYRGLAKGKNLEFSLGFSHPVVIEPPEGIEFGVEGPGAFSVKGISKQAVGETAAKIRKVRPPEPYGGKGVRYAGEYVRRKVGKAGK